MNNSQHEKNKLVIIMFETWITIAIEMINLFKYQQYEK